MLDALWLSSVYRMLAAISLCLPFALPLTRGGFIAYGGISWQKIGQMVLRHPAVNIQGLCNPSR
jgi:hypothetical protein